MAGARATGTMNRIACQLNSGAVNFGSSSQGAVTIAAVSTTPKTNDRVKPTSTPAMIGTRRKIPLPNTATTRVVSSAGIEIIIAVRYGSNSLPSPALPIAMFAAIGAIARPIEMITGPITTGGSSLSMKPVPLIFTARPMKV